MFLDELFEGVSPQLLTHKMRMDKAIEVLASDAMKATWTHHIPSLKRDVAGTSFSRGQNTFSRAVVVELSRERLSQDHKIMPLDAEVVFRAFAGISQEEIARLPGYADRRINRPAGQMKEEFVVGDVMQLHRYLTRVVLTGEGTYSDNELLNFYSMAQEYCTKFNIELVVRPKAIKQIKWAEQMREWDEVDP